MRKLAMLAMIAALPLFALSCESVYLQHCAACHQRFVNTELLKKNFVEMDNKLLKLKAPTINQLAFRLKEQIGDQEGDREFHIMEVTAFVKDYVYFPNRQKSICTPPVLRQFDTMPSMKGQISEADLESVTEWVYWSDIKQEEKK